jgi:hypothetical protein
MNEGRQLGREKKKKLIVIPIIPGSFYTTFHLGEEVKMILYIYRFIMKLSIQMMLEKGKDRIGGFIRILSQHNA